jgi:hypothetical protein
MKTLIRTALVIALGLAAGGCSVIEYNKKSAAATGREDLKNAQGHVVGYKDVIRDTSTGEEFAQIALFVPRVSDAGEVLGYEELVRGGSVLRDVHGKRIGGRWMDARSRATNPQNKGLLIVVRGKNSERFASAQAPEIDDLIHLARLTN